MSFLLSQKKDCCLPQANLILLSSPSLPAAGGSDTTVWRCSCLLLLTPHLVESRGSTVLYSSSTLYKNRKNQIFDFFRYMCFEPRYTRLQNSSSSCLFVRHHQQLRLSALPPRPTVVS
ncbi:uncharacterized protein LOC130802992 [Amaranthus tricolor]|uniref:uncharacterized protein LOC130802992 n=1 Tax=Amaranthus tricolor TaxID=29722 RepID=UPI002589DC01|nr:uncharacterized protein LOC130802992 [Amaranthus tricolor]